MSFFVYENWTDDHKARIHKGSCSFCKEGKGVHLGAGNENGMWHGPFNNFVEARFAAQKTGGHISYCKHCNPR